MGEALTSIILLLVSAFLLYQTFGFWGHGTDLGGIGPGWWPLCLLLITMAASIMLLRSALKKNPQLFSLANVKFAPKVLKTMLLFFAYVFLIDVIGFLIATPIFLLIFMGMLAPEKVWLKMGAVSLLTTFFFVYVFGRLMYTPLPRGSIEILRNLSRIFY